MIALTNAYKNLLKAAHSENYEFVTKFYGNDFDAKLLVVIQHMH